MQLGGCERGRLLLEKLHTTRQPLRRGRRRDDGEEVETEEDFSWLLERAVFVFTVGSDERAGDAQSRAGDGGVGGG